jgi:hypothetical protein
MRAEALERCRAEKDRAVKRIEEAALQRLGVTHLDRQSLAKAKLKEFLQVGDEFKELWTELIGDDPQSTQGSFQVSGLRALVAFLTDVIGQISSDEHQSGVLAAEERKRVAAEIRAGVRPPIRIFNPLCGHSPEEARAYRESCSDCARCHDFGDDE